MNSEEPNINRLLKLLSEYMAATDTSDLNRVTTMMHDIEKTSMGSDVTRHLMNDKQLAQMFERKWVPRKISVEELKRHPKSTTGKALYHYYTAAKIKKIDNPYTTERFKSKQAFVHARMRETHDLLHVITGFDPNGAGEVALATFCLFQHQTVSSVFIIFGALMENIAKGKPIEIYLKAIEKGVAMANGCKLIISYQIEDWLDKDLNDVRVDLGVHNPHTNRIDLG